MVPELVSVFISLLADASIANRADDNVPLVTVPTHATPVIVWPSMGATEYIFAELALEGHEVSLMTLGQVAVTSDLRF